MDKLSLGIIKVTFEAEGEGNQTMQPQLFSAWNKVTFGACLNIYVCVCVCYICMYTCVCIRMYVYVRMYVYIYIYNFFVCEIQFICHKIHMSSK